MKFEDYIKQNEKLINKIEEPLLMISLISTFDVIIDEIRNEKIKNKFKNFVEEIRKDIAEMEIKE